MRNLIYRISSNSWHIFDNYYIFNFQPNFKLFLLEKLVKQKIYTEIRKLEKICYFYLH
jgi:hypothetical protein